MIKSHNFKVSGRGLFYFMGFFNKIFQYINVLSLDVVAGAIICSLFFARVFEVSVSLYTIAVLAITVWVVYSFDHLRDARTISRVASTDRHRFHQKNFRILSPIVAIVGTFGFSLVWFIPHKVSVFGLGLALLVLIYLILQKHFEFLKEFFAACLYTGGILLPSLVMSDLDLQPLHFLLIGQFFLTALINLLLFSWFDYHHDQRHRQSSFVTKFGRMQTRSVIFMLTVINIFACFWLWNLNESVALIFLLMNSALLVILVLEKHFMVNNYYRILGDSIFILPLFYLL